jgi:hypothetical protein
VFKVLLAHKAFKVHPALKVFKVLLVLKAFKVQQGPAQYSYVTQPTL